MLAMFRFYCSLVGRFCTERLCDFRAKSWAGPLSASPGVAQAPLARLLTQQLLRQRQWRQAHMVSLQLLLLQAPTVVLVAMACPLLTLALTAAMDPQQLRQRQTHTQPIMRQWLRVTPGATRYDLV